MKVEFDKPLLNDVCGLSCVENFLLYAMKEADYEYKYLYHGSYLSMNDIAGEFIKNNARYASFYRIQRLQELAVQNNLIEWKYLRHNDFAECIDDYDYNAVMIKPEYIAAKYKTELWRDDHFLLIGQKDPESFYYLNDNPRDNGVISYGELKSIYAGEMIGFTIKNKISKALRHEFLDTFINSISAAPVLSSFEFTDLMMARDTLGVIRTSRKRICDYCGIYIPMDFYRKFILSIEKLYASIEYMRLRKSSDMDKINRQFEELQEQDIELASVLSAEMKGAHGK
ncbi:MAG: hypothetical protein FWD23_16255 [Oscillospiraceae bacterium]|nr:hypothetical protein [Oscillospiraceae bacterium]